jgi:hypothetical protein
LKKKLDVSATSGTNLMTGASTGQSDAATSHEITQFEVANPQIAEAMRLFGMSMDYYQAALGSLDDIRTTETDHTIVRRLPLGGLQG